MNKYTIVFDLDGTLVDTAPDILGTLEFILQRDNVPAPSRAESTALISIGARALIERAYAKAGRDLTIEQKDQLFGDFLDHYAGRIAEESTPYPHMVPALRALISDGFRLAICTNKTESLSHALIDKLGLSDLFHANCGRDTFAFCKPDGRHIRATVAKASGNPDLAIMVGDSETDINAAKDAGIPSIGVRFGYSEIPMDELNPDRVINLYTELGDAVAELTQRHKTTKQN